MFTLTGIEFGNSAIVFRVLFDFALTTVNINSKVFWLNFRIVVFPIQISEVDWKYLLKAVYKIKLYDRIYSPTGLVKNASKGRIVIFFVSWYTQIQVWYSNSQPVVKPRTVWHFQLLPMALMHFKVLWPWCPNCIVNAQCGQNVQKFSVKMC